jgi:hypothetical protein
MPHLVNKSFRMLASGLEYQHLIFRNLSDLQMVVHLIHIGLRKHARTMTVLFSLGWDKASSGANLRRFTTVSNLTPGLPVLEPYEPHAREWRSEHGSCHKPAAFRKLPHQ